MDIARGKNSLAQLLAASLAELVGEDQEYPKVALSVEKYYIAWQLWDDLCDWKEDFKDGVPSPLLTAALSELPSPERREECLPHLARKIYYDGHAVRTLDRALSLLEEADQELAFFKDLAWRVFISDLRRKCEALRDDLSRIIMRNLERSEGSIWVPGSTVTFLRRTPGEPSVSWWTSGILGSRGKTHRLYGSGAGLSRRQ